MLLKCSQKFTEINNTSLILKVLKNYSDIAKFGQLPLLNIIVHLCK